MVDALEIKVKTTAELSAMRQSVEELRRFVAESKAAGNSTTDLEARLKKEEDSLNAAAKASAKHADELSKTEKANSVFGKLGAAVDDLKGKFPALGAAIDFAKNPLVQLTAAMVASIKVFSEKESAVAKLDAALANAGQMTDGYRQKLQGLADEMESATAIAETKWMSVFSTLTKFGADTSNIEKYSEAVKNLAGFTGRDIESAAFIFGKAMTGNTTMLSRLGIQFDKSKEGAAQLDDIMQQLATRGAGQLEVKSKTLTGQWYLLKDSISDLLGGIGNLISQTGILQASLRAVSSVLNFFSFAFPKTIEKVEGLTNKLAPLAGEARNVADGLGEMGDEAEGLDALSTKGKSITEQFEAASAAIDKTRSSRDQLAGVKEALAIAKIDLEEAKAKAAAGGKLSPGETATFAARRGEAHLSAERDKFENERLAMAAKDQAASIAESRARGEVDAARRRASGAMGGLQAMVPGGDLERFNKRNLGAELETAQRESDEAFDVSAKASMKGGLIVFTAEKQAEFQAYANRKNQEISEIKALVTAVRKVNLANKQLAEEEDKFAKDTAERARIAADLARQREQFGLREQTLGLKGQTLAYSTIASGAMPGRVAGGRATELAGAPGVPRAEADILALQAALSKAQAAKSQVENMMMRLLESSTSADASNLNLLSAMQANEAATKKELDDLRKRLGKNQ